MKASWLFETDVYDENIGRVADEVRRQGMEAAYAGVTRAEEAAGRFDRSYLDLYPADSCVVFYGTLGFAGQVRREAPWVPGVYCTTENYRCSRYYPEFGRFLLAQDYVMVPFGDLVRRRDFLFDLFGIADALFIRPDSGAKVFTGQVIFRENWEKDLGLISPASISPGEMVVVTPPRNIYGEWRFVVADGEVIAGSSYRLDGETARERWDLVDDDDVVKLAREVAASGYQPDRVWTLDICESSRLEPYLLEINSFSSAGLYACDIEPVVREVSRIALEDWSEVYR